MNTASLATDDFGIKKYICWSAIFAGVVIAVITGSLWNLLGFGFGFVLFTPDADTLSGLGTGAIIWLIISAMISMLLGGWIAGRMSNITRSLEAALQGLVVWALATMITFAFVTTTAGALLSGTFNVISQSVSMVGEGAKNIVQLAPQVGDALKNVAPDVTPAVNKITAEADELIQQAIKNNSDQQTKQKLNQAIKALLTAAKDQDTSQVREKIIQILTQTTSVSEAEAEQTLDDWQQTYNAMRAEAMQKAEQAKQKAIEVTQKTTTALGQFAIVSFFVLLIGAGMAMLGGVLGTKK
jgi:hypothetical protein